MSVLELSIDHSGEPGRYDVEIAQSPVGEASATVSIDSEELMQQRDAWQQALLASATSTRRMVAGPETVLQGVGRALFETLLGNPVLSARYRSSVDIAAERGESLRLVLRLSAPELTPLPWEAMFDPQSGTYVCRVDPLVRRIPVASAPHPLHVRHPIRILGITASPQGLPLLDVEAEEQYLAHSLEEPLRHGQIELHWVRNATWERLQDILLSDEWHIVHFIGHGDFDVEIDEGVLALVGAHGRAHQVEASRFADLLHEASPMPRLVVLNSCLSALSGSADLFSGTASALVRGGVSAVVAMQFEITDPAAAAFARGFYSAIAAGRSVDQAVRSGRVSILGINGHTLEWITPVLYVRGQETRLFTIEKVAKAAPQSMTAANPTSTRSTDDVVPPGREYRSGGSHAVPSGDVQPPAPLPPPPDLPDDPAAPAGHGRSQEPQRKRAVLLWLLPLLLIPLIALAWTLTTREVPQAQIDVPDVVGQTYQEAAVQIRDQGLTPVREDEVNTAEEPGTVLRTDPGPGTSVDPGSEVTVLVAVVDPDPAPTSIEVTVEVPNVVGLAYPEAAALIEAQELVPAPTEEISAAALPGNVLRTSPGAGTPVSRGSEVTVVVAAAVPAPPPPPPPPPGSIEVTVEVPNVVGLTSPEAAAQITDRGLTPVPTWEVNTTEAPGTVLSTSPEAGTPVPPGSDVTMVVAVAGPGGDEDIPDDLSY